MSTFTNGTGTVNIDFSLLFDLRTTPVITITDISTYSAAQSDIKISIKVTRPDGIIRNYPSDPDITGNSGSLPTYDFTLPLASNDGQPVKGTYKIEYSFTVGDATAVVKTKSFDYQFENIKVELKEDINEFTPLVKIKDNTSSYAVTNYGNPSLSRVFTGSIAALSKTLHTQTTTGTTTSDREYRLEESLNDGVFYDAEYSVTCTLDLTYTNSSYSWVTIKEKIIKTQKVNVFKVPTKGEIIDYFDSLRNLVEQYDGSNKQLYDKYSADYEFVVSSFEHLERRLNAGDSDDENTDIIRDIIAILRNDVPRAHTNLQISATNTDVYATQLNWDDITNKPTYNPFQTWKQDKTTATWVVSHNLDKYPSVTTVDDSGNLIYGDVVYNSNNQITITFSAGVSGKVYLN